jgi:prophage DNA circulation protein
MSSIDDVIGNMQPASFRGVPFAVLQSESRFGRRIALHEYPYRDKPWPEDMGRATRKFSIQGFIITDSWVYGGGDVFDQRDKLAAAAETKNAGTLIHPTLGRLQVSIPDDGLIVTERLDAKRYMEFTLLCYEDGERQFPSSDAAAGDDSAAAADGVDSAAAQDFGIETAGRFNLGGSVFQESLSLANDFASGVLGAVDDAGGVFNLAAALPGNFGRFFNGALAGYATALIPGPVGLTLEGLVLAAAAARSVVIEATALFTAAAGATPAAIPPTAQVAVAALVGAIANPADAVRLLSGLADFYPPTPPGASPVGLARAAVSAAMGALARRTVLAGLVRVTAAYQPSSAADANTVRLAVCDLLDREALFAGDNGADASYAALVAARARVAADMDARGARLPPMREFAFPSSRPSLVLAWRLYQDAGRAPQLVDLANPVHPAFMPLAFRALAS